MTNGIKNLFTRGMWVALFFLFLRYKIGGFETLYDYISAGSEVIGYTIIIMGIYSTLLWRFNPFEKLPRIMGNYEGIIEYCFNGVDSKKEVPVVINQTLLTTNVRIVTNEISSSTITSSFLFENGEYILYYTYITSPKAKFNADNPIQYGTCRLRFENKDLLIGTYWTSQKTTGDISLTRVKTCKLKNGQ